MKKYYYSDGKQQFGPFSKEELQCKSISKDTLVWYEGLTEWTKAGDVEELVDLFPNTATPPPMPENKTVTPPPMPKQKNKKRKKILLIIGCILLVTISVYAVDQIIYHNKMNTIFSELENPKRHITIIDVEFKDNILSGRIKNNAKYFDCGNIVVHLYYYGNHKVIQEDEYTIEGSLKHECTKSFQIKVKRPQGLSFFSADSLDLKITDVYPYK